MNNNNIMIKNKNNVRVVDVGSKILPKNIFKTERGSLLNKSKNKNENIMIKTKPIRKH